MKRLLVLLSMLVAPLLTEAAVQVGGLETEQVVQQGVGKQQQCGSQHSISSLQHPMQPHIVHMREGRG